VNRDRLIIVRAGDASFHPLWLKNEPRRRWHLHISYYGARREPYELGEGVTLSHDPGRKFLGIVECLAAHPKFYNYGRIAFPDDDLKLVQGGWDDIFDMAESSGAALAQPALDHRSFFAHHATLRRAWADYRAVDFVELMAPIFETGFLREVEHLFAENQSSLGVDYVWSMIARKTGHKLAIIDKYYMLHTRALGGGAQYQGLDPIAEMKALLKKYNIRPWSKRSSAAYRNGKRLPVPRFLINRKQIRPRLFRLLKRIMGITVVG
jgi:hypothetical protein